MSFIFRGEISSSKSLFNRALIAQSFSEHVQIHGLSQSEDVLHLQKALKAFKVGENRFYCGDGGTTFRFLAVRVSRQRGEFHLEGSEQLFSRPMKELLHFFDQVGVNYNLKRTTLTISSSGWVLPPEITCTSTESSQFLSAIALSSWDLPRDLIVELPRQIPSRGYLQMTLDVLRECGLESKVQEASLINEPFLMIKAQQKPQTTKLLIEQDMSSLFSLAVCAILGGDIEIKNIPAESMQPDSVFFDYFRRMKIEYKRDGKKFSIGKQDNFRGIETDLTHTPDLFPALAVLCSKAHGITTLLGLHNLQFKESNRYEKTIELLRRLDRRIDKIDGGVMIHGRSDPFNTKGDFDPSGDHRMAMAAQAANLGGAQLNILNKSAVNKSFPEFWLIMGEDDQ
jgi:3-phosphoshikimate 1-carboxyvinyltransferase